MTNSTSGSNLFEVYPQPVMPKRKTPRTDEAHRRCFGPGNLITTLEPLTECSVKLEQELTEVRGKLADSIECSKAYVAAMRAALTGAAKSADRCGEWRDIAISLATRLKFWGPDLANRFEFPHPSDTQALDDYDKLIAHESTSDHL